MNRKLLALPAVLTALLVSPLTQRQAAGAEPAPNYVPANVDAYAAVNDPDRFAWQLFCAINAPAGNGHPRAIIWETWPEQAEIYADPLVAPQWPSAEYRGKKLRPSVQHRARRMAIIARQDATGLSPIPKPRDGVSNEEVRDNRDAFEYIVKNQLWYKEGIADKVRNEELAFPAGSIAIKGKWKVISEQEKERFHWQEYTEPDTGKAIAVGLVALHISSKIIPNWHWSTFEQVDNPGLADYIGVHDSFGMRPTDIAPNRRTNQGYSEVHGKPKDNVGVLTEEVRAMMKEHKLSPALSRYYRLKGAQIDFTDRTGRPTIVGNSVTEAGFVSTSSCITCHARASIGAPYQGQNNFPVPPPLSVFTDRGESFNGPVDASWFWDPTASVSSPPAQPEAFHKSVEFLWQLVYGPKARNSDPKDTQKP